MQAPTKTLNMHEKLLLFLQDNPKIGTLASGIGAFTSALTIAITWLSAFSIMVAIIAGYYTIKANRIKIRQSELEIKRLQSELR